MTADEDEAHSYQSRAVIELLREGTQLVQVAWKGYVMAQRNVRGPHCPIAAELDRPSFCIWPSAKGYLY